MKCVKRLTADQQRMAEENLTIVERVLRFDINANPCVAGLGYEDLYQEGCVWLCNAALTFDPARGSFASYARQVVQNGLVSYCRNLTGKQSRMISLAEMEPTALAALEVQHSAPFDIPAVLNENLPLLFILLLWDFFHQIIYTAMQDTCQAQQGFPLRLVNVFLALLILLDGAHGDFCLSCQFRLAHFGQCAQAL